MNFKEFEKTMRSRGAKSLAEIARKLDTTPQAVSNWKSRNQIPHHILSRLNQGISNFENKTSQMLDKPRKENLIIESNSYNNLFDNELSLSDIFFIIAEQIKIVFLITFISVFFTFTYVQFFQKSFYESSSKILLPSSQGQSGGMANLASQFGVNLNQGSSADLSSLSLFPELLKSNIFIQKILDEKFFVEEHQKELSLLAILNDSDSELPKDLKIINSTFGSFNDMVELNNEGKFSLLTVRANEPALSRDINLKVLDQLIELNRFFKSQNVSNRIKFIQSRIALVEKDLENSEQILKKFREQNRQVSSPALQLEQERISRDVDIQKGIFLTLKQQLELANIEKIQNQTVIQILDDPQIPISGTGKNLKFSVLLSLILGIGAGLTIGFLRHYLILDSVGEKQKLQLAKEYFVKKKIEILADRRFSGTVALLLFLGAPIYFTHKSSNPSFFGMYSTKFMILNSVYFFIFIFSIYLFLFYSKKNNR